MTMNSNLRILRRAALAACVLAGVLGMSRAVLADTVLRYSPRLPDNYAINSGALRPFMVEVEKVTEGRVRFEWLPKPLGTPRGQFDVVHDGVADMSVIVPGYTPGRFNAAELGELPLLSCDIDILAASFSEIYAERLQNLDMFEGTHVLSICSTTPSHVAPNNTAIRSLDDFKGQKLRVQNPTAAAILEQVSAVPSQKPVSEMYKMGASGIIDGGISPISVNGLFKTRAFFNKVSGISTNETQSA